MSKITSDCLTRSGTGCFIAVPIWQNIGHQTVKVISFKILLGILIRSGLIVLSYEKLASKCTGCSEYLIIMHK